MVNSTTVVNILEDQIREKENDVYNMTGMFKAIRSKKVNSEIDGLESEQSSYFNSEPYLMINSGEYEAERNLYAKRDFYKDIIRSFFNMVIKNDISLGSYPIKKEDISFAFVMSRLTNLRVDTPTKLVRVFLIVYVHSDAFTDYALDTTNYMVPLHKQVYITDDDIRKFGQEYNIKELIEFKMEDLDKDWRKEITYHDFTVLNSRAIEEQKHLLK